MLAFVCRFGVEVAGKFNGWVNAVEIIDEKFLEKKNLFLPSNTSVVGYRFLLFIRYRRR